MRLYKTHFRYDIITIFCVSLWAVPRCKCLLITSLPTRLVNFANTSPPIVLRIWRFSNRAELFILFYEKEKKSRKSSECIFSNNTCKHNKDMFLIFRFYIYKSDPSRMLDLSRRYFLWYRLNNYLSELIRNWWADHNCFIRYSGILEL